MSNGYCAWCGRGEKATVYGTSASSSSTENLCPNDDNSCWTKFQAIFARTSLTDSGETCEEEFAKYQRKTTEPFQLGRPASTTIIPVLSDDESAKRTSIYRRNASILRSVPARVPIEGRYGLLLPANRSPQKCLLVYSKTDDHVFECIRRAADRAGFEPSSCHGYDTALEEFQTRFHDLVILDTRHAKFDADTLCR